MLGHCLHNIKIWHNNSSPKPLEYLRKVDMAECGTVKKNRTHFPKQLIKRNPNANHWPVVGISAQCGELASDSFQLKPVDNLSETDLKDISSEANPDCSSERKKKSWVMRLKMENVMPIYVIHNRFTSSFLYQCLVQATITLIDFRLSYREMDKDARYFGLASWG